ncbi:diguanylate cyclase [Kaistia soli DSM 19436]|uniref:diguanylate cyclase n=1 Tax=Kaistia soli DSM 19436 TaxID=1122133 RepID=A0A1M5GSI0_9HYPH|nr:GGDEF domain-containing protein [Kaistia soli]SHG06706.1 diguanylate cyclase [Kaistia soli DSM 19436]
MVARSFEDTALLAQRALALLKAYDLPAEPRYYALWYAYVAEREPLLNEAIDGIIRERGRLSLEEVSTLQRAFLDGRTESEAARCQPGEPDPILAAIATAALDGASDAALRLAVARDAIKDQDTRHSTEDLVNRLVTASRIIDQRKRRIEAELAEARSELDMLQTSLDHVRHESMRDQLTTLASRKHFDDALAAAIGEATTTATPLSLLFTDIDNFKSFNDRYGHQTGDHVLRLVALAAKQNIRGQDTACRYGGEEFAIILPRTPIAQATIIGEAIREAVMNREIRQRSTGERLSRVTISIGIASFRPGDTTQTMIERADSCLYGAKSGGRNLVVVEVDPLRRNSA